MVKTNGHLWVIDFKNFSFQNWKKVETEKICVLYCSFWSNQDLDMFSTLKWPSVIKFFERYYVVGKKMTRKDPEMAKLKDCIFYIKSENTSINFFQSCFNFYSAIIRLNISQNWILFKGLDCLISYGRS